MDSGQWAVVGNRYRDRNRYRSSIGQYSVSSVWLKEFNAKMAGGKGLERTWRAWASATIV
ncbi:protein of unknown function [Candidatus Promineifilum breve]|uniref:Uncharacterized protein n=1 Tax=Candidatus Promineifilum breve TaxID=1806508 RepID=A0A160TB18_9CHLR|nr:protein of unknown function [Candidatus Promineifilum breve]